MQYAYFAKRVFPDVGSKSIWICVATNCSAEETLAFDRVFTVANCYVRTKLVELD